MCVRKQPISAARICAERFSSVNSSPRLSVSGETVAQARFLRGQSIEKWERLPLGPFGVSEKKKRND